MFFALLVVTGFIKAVGLSGSVGESSLRFLFLGFLWSRVKGAIPTKVTKFPAGVALSASRTLVELSAVINIVSIGLMI